MPPSGVDYASGFLNGYAPEYVGIILKAHQGFDFIECLIHSIEDSEKSILVCQDPIFIVFQTLSDIRIRNLIKSHIVSTVLLVYLQIYHIAHY